ncbi:hypothetical protein GCM10025880_34340 [Methylorubrum aminovorans]|nr:hypothetical protein GCM10025880_34340 [Methylorubrum aminovorans]
MLEAVGALDLRHRHRAQIGQRVGADLGQRHVGVRERPGLEDDRGFDPHPGIGRLGEVGDHRADAAQGEVAGIVQHLHRLVSLLALLEVDRLLDAAEEVDPETAPGADGDEGDERERPDPALAGLLGVLVGHARPRQNGATVSKTCWPSVGFCTSVSRPRPP